MVDRLEEVLAMLEDEDEDEEKRREDVPALTDWTAPAAAAPEEDGETAADRGRRRNALQGLDAGEPLPAAGETADVEGPLHAEEPEDGPVWRPEAGAAERAGAAWRRELAGQTDDAAVDAARMAAEAAVERLSVEKGGALARAVKRGAESGLEGLYRQAVQASRPAPQALPVEQAGRTLRAEEPGRAAALTVDELDRAVRRDSRRYDGGMTIF